MPLSTRVVLRAGGDADRATARLYICELRQDGASGHSTQAFGVYQDELPPRRRALVVRAAATYQSLARSGRGEVFAFPAEAVPDGESRPPTNIAARSAAEVTTCRSAADVLPTGNTARA